MESACKSIQPSSNENLIGENQDFSQTRKKHRRKRGLKNKSKSSDLKNQSLTVHGNDIDSVSMPSNIAETHAIPSDETDGQVLTFPKKAASSVQTPQKSPLKYGRQFRGKTSRRTRNHDNRSTDPGESSSNHVNEVATRKSPKTSSSKDSNKYFDSRSPNPFGNSPDVQTGYHQHSKQASHTSGKASPSRDLSPINVHSRDDISDQLRGSRRKTRSLSESADFFTLNYQAMKIKNGNAATHFHFKGTRTPVSKETTPYSGEHRRNSSQDNRVTPHADHESPKTSVSKIHDEGGTETPGEMILRHASPGCDKQNKHREGKTSGIPTRPAEQVVPRTPPSKEQGTANRMHSSGKKKKTKPKIPFEDYWSKEEVSAALKRGQIHKGSLRISPKNYEMAWVSLKEFKRDIMILGMHSRNRALDGDVVALEILPKENWQIMHEEMRFHGVQDDAVADMNASAIESIPPSPTSATVADATNKLGNLCISSDQPNDDKRESDNCLKSPKKQTKSDVDYKIDINKVPERYLQRTAKVVFIIERKHPRVACGYLKPMADSRDPDALFSPTDHRLPRFRIAHDDCPPGFFNRPQDFASTLIIARMTEWRRDAPLDCFLAQGVFARSLGEAGEIEPETESILIINEIDSNPFSHDALTCLPKDLPWKIPQEELDMRRDFRDTCVFTIDPATARDLDDALHCVKLEDGNFEVGVHIADVSYFVREGTALDEVASSRATSTYMVQKVVPMLPRLLCEELCSLNPCEERLTFSVVWKLGRDGAIHDEWMGKGVILSRVKLSYEHAQDMIEQPEKVWSSEEHPPLADGASIAEIAECVCNLNEIAVKLRRKRFENGTLRLNKAKVSFDLDRETGMPIGWHEYVQRESNKLIEEYMLLANMAVAHRIYDAFPERAMLRCHPEPDARQLEEVSALCNSLGIDFSHESSKGIQETLNTFTPDSPEHLVLSQLSMKPMRPAKYFSSATAKGDPDEFMHYALSVPLYTHFTSPIRRYPDVVVHRLLSACLKVDKAPAFTPEELQKIADHCNDRKLAAKKAGEESVELYLGVFVRECGPLTEDGIVVSVMRESIDVLVIHFGIIKRVYFKFCDEVKSFEFQEGDKTRPAEVLVSWKGPNDPRKASGGQTGAGTRNRKHDDSRAPESSLNRLQDSFKVFTPVQILLRSEIDRSTNKIGLKFCGEILPHNVPSS